MLMNHAASNKKSHKLWKAVAAKSRWSIKYLPYLSKPMLELTFNSVEIKNVIVQSCKGIVQILASKFFNFR